MITKITNANRDQYAKLFEKARIALNIEEENDLNSLDLYFTRIADLANKDPHFTVLPLDEEPFVIDADKRTIEVPRNFTTNGLCVQGDEAAEIVFFSIDRYFDSIDLNTQQIAIQWERPDGVIGISPEYVRDITSKEGKLLFGWVLDSEITSIPGKLKFSVRFYSLATEGDTIKEITYSFSTLTQTAIVQPALDLNVTDPILSHIAKEDLQRIMVERLINSSNDELPIPKAPIFAGVLNPSLDKCTNATILIEDTKDHNKTTYKGYADIKNLYVEKDGDVDRYYLWAYADVVGSTSNATYTWKKLTKQPDGSFNSGTPLSNVVVKYLPLTVLGHGDAKHDNGAYYLETEDFSHNKVYTLVPDEDLEYYNKEELFRRVSCAEITEEGIYRVIAKTVINAGEGKGSVQSETIKNPYVTFYFFKPREITSLNSKELLPSSTMAYEPYDVGYTSDDTNISQDATVVLNTNVVKTQMEDPDKEWEGLNNLSSQYHLNNAADAAEEVIYQWYKESDIVGEADTLLTGMTKSTLTLGVGASGNFSEAVGFYKVEAINKRNGSESTKKTNRYRVTYLPTAPEITEGGDMSHTFATLGTTELSITVAPTSDMDKIYCKWYVTDENKTTFTEIPGAESSVTYDSTKENYTFTFTPTIVEGLIDGGEYIVAKSWVELNTKLSNSVVSSVAGVMNN